MITFYGNARDFDTIRGPNVGKSREIRLRIVSKEDAVRQFDDARRELREELSRVLNMQKQAMTPVDNAVRTLSQTNRLAARDRDDLKNGAMIQRQVTSRINNRDEGVGARITHVLDDLKNFKIDNADAQKQMEDMLAQVAQIREQHLGPAEHQLARATKTLEDEAALAKDAQTSPGANPETNQPAAADRRKPTQKARRRRVRLRLPPRRLSRKNLHLESNLSVRPRRAPSAGTRQREKTSR